MAKTDIECKKIQAAHKEKMKLIKSIKDWLFTQDFKSWEVNKYELKLNNNLHLYVRLGTHVSTIGHVYSEGGVIKTKLIESIKYKEGYNHIVGSILEKLKH